MEMLFQLRFMWSTVGLRKKAENGLGVSEGLGFSALNRKIRKASC